MKCVPQWRSLRKRTARAGRRMGIGLVAAAAVALVPWAAHAEDGWAEGRQFALLDSAGDSGAPAPITGQESLVVLQAIFAAYRAAETGETQEI